MRAIVFRQEPGQSILEGRTARSLRAAGIEAISIAADLPAAAHALRQAVEPSLLIRAGTWFVSENPLPHFPPSATGRALLGLGAAPAPAGHTRQARADAERWTATWKKCGGDLEHRGWWPARLPVPPALYLEPDAARLVGEFLEDGDVLPQAVENAIRTRRFRAIHLPALDAHFDAGLRVVQVVTTIQIGGAERVTLDLAAELWRHGIAVCVAALGLPTRLAFAEPANFADLSAVPHDPLQRAAALARLCRSFGGDLIHAHLIRAREAQAIRDCGIPLVMTVHNMPQSWPLGLATAGHGVADLLLACSKAVAVAARERLPELPVRVVWNGIDPVTVAPTPARLGAGADLRRSCGFSESDFVLAAVANPRRQKRLDRLPEILERLDVLLGPDRRARLLLAGAPAGGNRDAEEALGALQAAIERSGCAASIHWTGPVLDIAPILAAADALISVSEFEGLSLAHLEALAAGLPVVATDVGGTREIAARSPRLRLVSPEADAASIAAALAEIARTPAERTAALPKSFTRDRMARRYRFFYPRVIDQFRKDTAGRRGCGLWLITNNFSTGGAQSSARRLLCDLAGQGFTVRAAVVQERPDTPTPGRRALIAAGIPVEAIPPPGTLDAEDAVECLLGHINAEPPKAVVFWNLLASYKLLLADGLLDIPVYDVSPGEMYFESLKAYFANPRSGLPYDTPAEYGRRLAGVVVKYAAEAHQVESLLGVEARVIPNGVSLPPPQRKPPRSNSLLAFGTAARLAPQKRLEDLLAAFRLALPRLPRCTLRIAGGIEAGQRSYARDLRRLARGLPVQWCGELPETNAFLQEIDIFVMISEPAGCPNASLEAMAAGLPIIATDVGGASEQVIHHRTGLLVARRDHLTLAEAMVTLAHDPDLCRRLASNARKHVSRNFSMRKMIASYSELFGLASPLGNADAVQEDELFCADPALEASAV